VGRIQLLYNQPQTLPLYMVEGRPDGPVSLTVYRKGTTPLAPPAGQSWPVSVALDPVDTTVAVAAAARAHKLTLASVAGVVVGRRYLVMVLGRREEVTVAGVDPTTLEVHLTQQLRFAVPDQTAFLGHRLAIPFEAAQLVQRGRDLRLELAATIAGEALLVTEYFDIVTELLRIRVGEADIIGAGFRTTAPGLDMAEVIDDAHGELVDALMGEGVYPDLVKAKAALKPPMVYKCRELISATVEQYTKANFWAQKFSSAMAKFFNNPLNWVDADDDQVNESHAHTTSEAIPADASERPPIRRFRVT